jgi:ribokinase
MIVSNTLVVVGSLNMDLVVRSPRFPAPGETVIGGAFQAVPGGKGSNQAVAAARLGAQVAMIGRVGPDAYGSELIEGLVAAGIDHSHVHRDPETATGVALIVVTDRGENSIVVAPGANLRLSPADVDRAEATIASAQTLLLQLESPIETVHRAAQVARSHGVRVILNPAPARALPAELLALVDVLIPNESEAAILAGDSVDNRADAEAAAAGLLRLGIETVILTLGSQGSLLAGRDMVQRYPPYDVEPVDTTAAGDAFVGGLAVALTEGQSLPDAVRWGNAAGALAATKPGAQPSLPTRIAVQDLLSAGSLR